MLFTEPDEFKKYRSSRNRWSKVPRFAYTETQGYCHECGKEFEKRPNLYAVCKKCIKGRVRWLPGVKISDGNFIYGLYSADNKLLYIGITVRPHVRFHQHYVTKNFDHMRVICSHTSREVTEDLERWLIFECKPKLNIVMDKGWPSFEESWRGYKDILNTPPDKPKKSARSRRRKSKSGSLSQKSTQCFLCKKTVSPNPKRHMEVAGMLRHISCSPSTVKAETKLKLCDWCSEPKRKGAKVAYYKTPVRRYKYLHRDCKNAIERYAEHKKLGAQKAIQGVTRRTCECSCCGIEIKPGHSVYITTIRRQETSEPLVYDMVCYEKIKKL